MEALAAVAAVLSVCTAGLQSAKFIYQTVCDIQKGPKGVKTLAAATDNLSKLLEQTEKLCQEAKGTISERDTQFFEGLSPLLFECATELGRIKGKLSGCTGGQNRLWKNVKVFFDEKDFDNMERTISHYVQSIGVQLNNAGM